MGWKERKWLGRLGLALVLAVVGTAPGAGAQRKKPAEPPPRTVREFTIEPAVGEGHPKATAAPRITVDSEPLPRASQYGLIVCDAEAAIGLKRLTREIVSATCDLPYTIVAEEP